MQAYVIATMRHAENFLREDGTTVKAGNVVNSTKATYSLSARAYFFEGLLVQNPNWPKIPEDFKPVEVGEYLLRQLDGDYYMVNTRQIQPRSPGQDYIFMAKTNAKVTLARPRKKALGQGNAQDKFEVYAEGVRIFMDTTTRSFKEQNDGLLPQDITIIHVPARYGIQRMDRVYLLDGGKPLEECEFYRVDSINDALTTADDPSDVGVDVMQLSEDKRVGEPSGEANPSVPKEDDGW